MRFSLETACGCNMGKHRKNNEDNFYFEDKCLELDNQGLRNITSFSGNLRNGLCLAVFDGMGGENYGEVAAYTAARKMQETTRALSDYIISERRYLSRLTSQLNDAIVDVKKQLRTDRCGSTMAALYFSSGYVYACNGDDRTITLNEIDGELQQDVRISTSDAHHDAQIRTLHIVRNVFAFEVKNPADS